MTVYVEVFIVKASFYGYTLLRKALFMASIRYVNMKYDGFFLVFSQICADCINNSIAEKVGIDNLLKLTG